MVFNSLEFIAFFALAVILYFILPKKCQNPLLFIASYVFYAYYNPALIVYLIITTVFAYLVAIKTEKQNDKKKKLWMILGVVLNVAALAVYKYTDFLFDTITSITNNKLSLPRFDFIVPLGISFIVFQVISYLVDVYRGKIKVERNILHFALYVSFFPKVMQGPITRAGDFLPQLNKAHYFDMSRFRDGAITMLYGLFMKMVIADRAAIIVNSAYSSPESFSGAAVALATILFAIQIYCDFAGYSYIAIGAARILGFELKDNFKQPYLSGSVSEFWRRWHITLNDWLKDYIYFPLGGSRCSKFRRDINSLITFGISGLWHGANFGYIIWGLLNGGFVVAEKHIEDGKKKRGTLQKATGIKLFCKRAITCVLITFTWIFFRAQTLSGSFTVIKRIFVSFEPSRFINDILYFIRNRDEALFMGLGMQDIIILAAVLVIGLIIDIIADKTGNLSERASGCKIILRWALFYALIFSVILFGIYGYGYSASSFIYAQF